MAAPPTVLPDLIPTTGNGKGTYSGNVTLNPGYYSAGITDTSGGSNLILNPGVYILGGKGLKTGSTATVTANANGVMLYFIGTGILDLNGTGQITLSPPLTGTWAGVSIFQ